MNTGITTEPTKKITNKKPGLIEGMKMKKAANQRRLSHAIIQNTNKVKEKVKDWFFKWSNCQELDISNSRSVVQQICRLTRPLSQTVHFPVFRLSSLFIRVDISSFEPSNLFHFIRSLGRPWPLKLNPLNVDPIDF